MFGTPRFSTILAATVLLAAAAVLAIMVGMNSGSPGGDVAHASDPEAGRAADEAEAKAVAEAQWASRVELGEVVAVQAAGGLTTKAIDLPAVQTYCRTVDYNYNDCVTVGIVLDALQGDCTECRTLEIWILYDESGRVTGLSKTGARFSLGYGSLENMGLSGVIPPEIGDLTALTELELGNSLFSDGPPNELTGPIPSEIGNLTSLTWLALDSNQLTGSIPSQIGNLTSLTWLSLSGNQLSGPIPSQIGNLTSLTSLWLYGNQLTGPIPPEIGKLTNLTHLALSSNRLTGPIPPELGKLTNLEYLSIDFNQLTGCVPASLQDAYQGDDYPICTASSPTSTPTPAAMQPGACDTGSAVANKSNTGLVADCNALLTAKDTLRGSAALNWAPNTAITRWNGITLAGTPRRVTKVKLHKKGLSGQIPANLGSLDMLEELWLYVNDLSGSIPPEIGNLTNLRMLFVSNNNLSGQIPETLNNLSLDRLWLQKNSFTGCVPYNLTLTREYKVDRGLAACAPPAGDGTPTPAPTAPAGTPTPVPPGATPTPAPTAEPGNTDTRLTAIEGRLDDIERRVASLEATVAGLTDSTPTPTATP